MVDRLRTVRRLVVVVVLAAVVAAFAALVPVASADTVTRLPMTGFGEIAVDSATGHVFVSSGPSGSSVVVMAANGGVIKSLTGLSGATGMAMSGRTLFIAGCGSDAISTVDLDTLTVTGSIPVPSGVGATGKCTLAIAGGRLWFVGGSSIDSMTIAAPHTIDHHATLLGNWPIGATPAAPNELVLAASSGTTQEIYAYDLSAGGVLDGQATNLGPITDVALVPDGTRVLVARIGAPLGEFVLPGLTDLGSTYTEGGSIAVSPDSQFFARDGEVYQFGDPIARRTFDFMQTSIKDQILPGGVAFSGDAKWLYYVTGSETGMRLRAIDGPTLRPTTISLTPSNTLVTYGGSVTLTAQVGACVAPCHVDIYKTPRTGARTLAASGVADASGAYSVALRPSKRTTYDAVFVGDDTYLHAASVPVRVNVAAIAGIAAIRRDATASRYAVYDYAASCSVRRVGCPTFVGSLTPHHDKQQLTFTVQRLTRRGWRGIVSAHFPINRRTGKVAIIWVYRTKSIIGQRYRIQSSWAGDRDHDAARSAWAYWRVRS